MLLPSIMSVISKLASNEFLSSYPRVGYGYVRLDLAHDTAVVPVTSWTIGDGGLLIHTDIAAIDVNFTC